MSTKYTIADEDHGGYLMNDLKTDTGSRTGLALDAGVIPTLAWDLDTE